MGFKIERFKRWGQSVKNSSKNWVQQGLYRLRRALKWLIPICILLISILLVVIIPRRKEAALRREEAARKIESQAGPRVQVARVTQVPSEHTLSLIGETRPYQQAIIYAKISGYLKNIFVDKGDVVKKGQILAVIDSPETDQAYKGALADARNKRLIHMRVRQLFAQTLVSPQERDQARSDAGVSTANLRTQEVLKSYETLRAPYDGTVTARFADPGALVQNATDSRSSALPVVTVSEINRLRVDVFVDQDEAGFIQKNEPVVITRNDPGGGQEIRGRISRVSDALDPRTKMLLTEIDIPNEKHSLVAGSFVHVSLKIKSPPYLMAPVEALVLKDGKSYLTVVTRENRITYKPIQIESNDGKALSIISGVQLGDQVALNLGDTLPEGGKVRPILETGPTPAPTHSGKPNHS